MLKTIWKREKVQPAKITQKREEVHPATMAQMLAIAIAAGNLANCVKSDKIQF